jgi:hypothetical protein
MKGKFRPLTGHVGPERKYSYSSTLSLPFTLDGDGRLTQRHGRLSPAKETRYPLNRTRL